MVNLVNSTSSLHRENENVCPAMNTYILYAVQLSKKIRVVLWLSGILTTTSNSISWSKDAAKWYSEHFNAVLKIWLRSCIDLYSRTESSFFWAVFEGEIDWPIMLILDLLLWLLDYCIFHGQQWTECFNLGHNFIFMWTS